MKNFLKKYKNIVFISMLFITALSCDEGGDPDPGGTVVEKLAGNWYCKEYNAAGDVLADYHEFSTYNTASNTSEMWVDGPDAGEPFKAKTDATVSEFTFARLDSENISNEGTTVSITNGRVFLGEGISTGENVTDSIYFNIEYSTNPGEIITIAGYKRTGFLEDEH